MMTNFRIKTSHKKIPYKFLGIVFLIVIFPLFPLIPGFFQTQGFYIDWWNHLWMTNYFSVFFEHNFSFPMIINTNNFGGIGNPSPLFYGYLFYPILGILGSAINADIALRLPFFFLWLVQFVALYKVFNKISDSRLISLTVTALSLWTIYPLTNIFNRSALTEAYATGLLTVSFCCLILFLHENKRKHNLRYLSLLGLSITLVIGSHPITGLFGSCFLGIIFLIHIINLKKNPEKILKKIPLLFGVGIFSLLILSPWLYVLFEFGENLRISTNSYVRIFPNNIDFFLSRFLPFPLDLRALVYGFKVEGGTPFLETQTNVPLGIFFIWLAYSFSNRNIISKNPSDKQKKPQFELFKFPEVILSICLFGLTTFMSLSKIPYEYLPNFFKNIEFGYRMVYYQNLSIIFAVYSLFNASQKNLINIEKTKFKKFLPVVITLCLSFSFIACLEKNMHGLAIVGFSKPEIPKNIEQSAQLNRQYYGAYKYTVNTIPQLEENHFFNVNFKIDLDSGFGKIIKPIHINLSEPKWIRTNIHAFPWNQIEVNGNPLKKELIKQVKGESNTGLLTMDSYNLAFELNAGQYKIDYRFRPTSIYIFMRNLSLWLILSWIGGTIIYESLLLFNKILFIKKNH